MSTIGFLSLTGTDLLFGQFVSADPNLYQYGFGQLYTPNGEPKVKQEYPGMWVQPQSTSVPEYSINRQYQFLIYDVVFDNQNKVVSDMEEIAFRLIRFLRLSSDMFIISGIPTIRPFNDKWLDNVSGVIVDVTIEFNGESSNCMDPDYNFNIQNNQI